MSCEWEKITTGARIPIISEEQVRAEKLNDLFFSFFLFLSGGVSVDRKETFGCREKIHSLFLPRFRIVLAKGEVAFV